MISDCQLIIFDWDGTLMDSSEKIVNCFNGAATDFTLELPDPMEVKGYIGISLVQAFQNLYPNLEPAVISGLVSAYREHWLFHDHTPMSLFPGVDDGLKRLAEYGYLLAVATGKSWKGLERSLKETDLQSLFTFTRCADQSKSKPDPQMLLDILDYTGLESHNAIMIGDTTYDLQMAKTIDMKGMGVSYGSHSADVLSALSDGLICHDFSEVVKHFID